MNVKTALLIFARTASEESKHKTFNASKLFFEYQNRKLIELAKTSGLPYFWIDETQQIGDNFQERFLNAIQSSLNKGFDQIISIGNDSPELNLSHINKALESLKHNDMCFGPTLDGGFYLWGVKKDNFEKKRCLQFSWKTRHLLSEVLDDFKTHSISVECIDILSDLDQREDALLLLKNSKLPSFLLKILNLILIQNQMNFIDSEIIQSKPCFRLYYNKGSPMTA